MKKQTVNQWAKENAFKKGSQLNASLCVAKSAIFDAKLELSFVGLAKEELRHLANVKKINKGFKNLDDYTRGLYEGRIEMCKRILKKAGK